MRKLISIYRRKDEELRFYQCPNKLSAVITSLDRKQYLNGYDSVRKDVNDFIQNGGEKQIIDFLGFKDYYKVPFERKNGKIKLFPINKQKRVIWTNDDYAEWCDAMKDEITEEEITPEYYDFCCETNLSDEMCNLDVDVDGYIVAFANLGLWNGRRQGAKIVGDNVKDIFSTFNDYDTFYCDPFNVKQESIHHDGTNYILYRVAKDKAQAERLVNSIAYKDMSEESFRRATKSLRPYVAKVFGW